MDYEKCRNCGIVSFCGGGCIADSLTSGKNELLPECLPYTYCFDEYIKTYARCRLYDRA